MPNHIHGIICIVGAPLVGALSLEFRMGCTDRAGAGPKRRVGTRPAPTFLGDVVGIFKSISPQINISLDISLIIFRDRRIFLPYQ
jgi:hypothetical protein